MGKGQDKSPHSHHSIIPNARRAAASSVLVAMNRACFGAGLVVIIDRGVAGDAGPALRTSP
jgi:hypothetical protein